MNGRSNLFGASSNPLLQALSVIVFALLAIGAVVMGAVILAVVLGLAVIGALVFYVRLWSLRRSIGRPASPQRGSESEGELIEGEYTVVEQRDPSYPDEGRSRTQRPQARAVPEDDAAMRRGASRRAGR